MFPQKIDIKEVIKEARLKQSISQNSLALFCGVTKQAISKIELGESIPDESTIIGLARALKLDYDLMLFNCHPKLWIEKHVRKYLKTKRKILKKYDDLVFDVLQEYLINIMD